MSDVMGDNSRIVPIKVIFCEERSEAILSDLNYLASVIGEEEGFSHNFMSLPDVVFAPAGRRPRPASRDNTNPSNLYGVRVALHFVDIDFEV